jgi:hypothetical protein
MKGETSMKLVSVFGSTLLALILSTSLACSEDWTPFQLALFNPVQVFPEKTNVYGVRLNIIYGNNRELKGVDYGPVNIVEKETKGVQVGAWPFGGVNVSGMLKGVQLAGVFGGANLTDHDANGFQAAGILGGANIVNGTMTGLQVSGVIAGVNLARRMEGVQLAGILGGVNIATNAHGAQIATLYNHAETMRGAQVGLVNFCEKMYGVQVGLVNIIRDGGIAVLPIVNGRF